MIAYLVTQEPSDVELLQRVLPPEVLEGVGVVAAGRLSSVKSRARSILVGRRVPVAIVFNVHSTVDEVIQERRQATEEMVGLVTSGEPFKVFPAVPDLNTVCAHGPDAPLLLELAAFLRKVKEAAPKPAGATSGT